MGLKSFDKESSELSVELTSSSSDYCLNYSSNSDDSEYDESEIYDLNILENSGNSTEILYEYLINSSGASNLMVLKAIVLAQFLIFFRVRLG